MPALDPRLLVALKSFQTDRIRDISTTTVNRINMEIGQVALGVQDVFAAARKVEDLIDAPRSRALSIVRTELGTAYSEAGQQRMEQAVQLGVKGLQKQWRRSGKIHPRVTHDLADGQIVDVDKPFLVGGIEIPKPRDPSIPIGERVNCGCQSLPYMRHWRVSTPGPKPYTAEELARSPSARQADEARHAPRSSTARPEPRRFGSLAEEHAALQAEYEPWAKGLSREERYAISHYKGFDGFALNAALRKNAANKMMEPVITSLDQAISRASLPAPTRIWRGEGSGTANIGLQPGDISEVNAGYFSASIRQEMAEGSSDGGVLLEIVLPAGYPAAYINGVPFPIKDLQDLADSEFEMILPRGLRFRVLKREGNRLRVELLS
ncbi:ADP-ribosyltransferase [Castellaniella sp.]|uniref:ADP-ribosyltransferase n=1 Tax=Castellaniella sp. TaxID=1955812 RepID=UPI002AFF94A9|nr:ADP-ribosyltransferase [Castellaniella sp.]